MKRCFQLVDRDTGSRSKPFVMTSSALADELFPRIDKDGQIFYVLLVGDVDEEGNLKLSDAPLITAANFVFTFRVVDLGENHG